MNDKELFYLFLKHSDVVVRAYKYLLQEQEFERNLAQIKLREAEEANNREDFDIVFNEIHEYMNRTYRTEYAMAHPDQIHYVDCYLERTGFNKYGDFANISLYKKAKWTLDVIEKYKESIVWLLLLEHGDYVFSEEILKRYEKYIPWIIINDTEPHYSKKYHDPFYVYRYNYGGKTFCNFSKVGMLSSDFIISHLSIIDMKGLCNTGAFEMTKELFKEIYENAEMYPEFEDPYNGYTGLCTSIKNNHRIIISFDTIWYIAKEIKARDWELLLLRMEWTPEHLLKMYELKPDSFEVFYKLDFDDRNRIVFIIRQDERLRTKVSEEHLKKLYQGGELYVKDIRNLLMRLKESNIYKELPYTYDFSIDLIKNNLDNWNQYICNTGRRRNLGRDNTEVFSHRNTVWEFLAKQPTIFLTYELCKYLINLEIMVGGTDEEIYYTDERHEVSPNHLCNALKVFQGRDAKNEEEYNKIAGDMGLVDFFLTNSSYVNNILKKIITNFFKDFSFEKFEELAKCFKQE